MRYLASIIALFLILGVCGIGVLHLMFSRTGEFRAQAKLGQPIVRAIENFRAQTGSYPPSLAALVPKYLPTEPELPDKAQRKFRGWDFRLETNGVVITYCLRYYMGKGGIEYRPPHWIGNDEGSRKIILSNE